AASRGSSSLRFFGQSTVMPWRLREQTDLPQVLPPEQEERREGDLRSLRRSHRSKETKTTHRRSQMKPDQSPAPRQPPMGLDDMIRELAAGLRDVIENTDTAYLEKDPEEAFIDLACRLVFRVREKITVTPVPSAEERTRIRHADAAARIFDIFTEWMRANPE